jgi:glutamate-1-semialdehyde aminotransferase
MPDHGEHSRAPDLISVEAAKQLSPAEVADLFRQHVNPGQLHFLKLLGFHDILVDRAEGMYYTDRHGRRILDFFGGFGALAMGHNHPRILEVRRRFQDEHRHEIAIAFLSQYASALAANLARIAPGDLDMVFLGSTGSEAVEAALKLAERVQGPERSTIVTVGQRFCFLSVDVPAARQPQEGGVRRCAGAPEGARARPLGADRDPGNDPGWRRHRHPAARILAACARAV